MGRTTTPARGAHSGLDGLLTSPWVYALVALAAAIVYWQAPKYPLGRFDEDSILMPNMEYLVKTATLTSVIKQDAFFRSKGKVFYRPVQNVSYMIDAKIGRGKASTFITSSMLLHALASCLVLMLLRQLATSVDITAHVSVLFALFFAVNPLFAQAVAWTPGRGDLLLAVFALGSLLTFQRYLTSGSVAMLATHALLTTLAIFSKETGIVLVALLPLSWLLLGQARNHRSRLLLTSAIAVLASMAMFAARAAIITETTPTNDFAIINLVTNLRVFPEIIAKLFAPLLLQTMAGYTTTATVLGGLLLVGLAVILVQSIRSGNSPLRNIMLMGLGWYGAFLLPGAMYTHRFGSAAYDYLEHRGYVPVIGLVLILGVLLSAAARRLQTNLIALGGVIIIAVYGAFTWNHVKDFASAITFYDQTVQTNPASALARANRGQLRQVSGDVNGAIDDYNAALASSPDFIMAHFGLGNAYLNRQQYPEAIVHLRAALSLDTTLARLGVMIGNAHLGANNSDSAAYWYRYTYDRDATDFESALNLGVIEARRGNWLGGLELFTQATLRAPSQSAGWVNRGIANQNLGRMSDACSDWLRAEQLGDAQGAELRQKNCR